MWWTITPITMHHSLSQTTLSSTDVCWRQLFDIVTFCFEAPCINVFPYSHIVYVRLSGDSSGCGVNMGCCQPITVITTCRYFSVEIFHIFVHCLSCYKYASFNRPLTTHVTLKTLRVGVGFQLHARHLNHHVTKYWLSLSSP